MLSVPFESDFPSLYILGGQNYWNLVSKAKLMLSQSPHAGVYFVVFD